MMPLWPLLILLPPLAITVLGGRSAWLWLSLAIGVAAMTALIQSVMFSLAQGHETSLAGLFTTRNIDRAYHDSYYVVANLTAYASTILPALIAGALLFIRAHPRRHVIDIALFWAVVVLVLLNSYGLSANFGNRAMPSRYIDYGDIDGNVFLVSGWITMLALALAAIAIARPLLSAWRTRKAKHAL